MIKRILNKLKSRNIDKYYFDKEGTEPDIICTEDCLISKEFYAGYFNVGYVKIGSVYCQECKYCLDCDNNEYPEWIKCSKINKASGKLQNK